MKGFVVAVKSGIMLGFHLPQELPKIKMERPNISGRLRFYHIPMRFIPSSVFSSRCTINIHDCQLANPPRPPYHPQRHLRHLGRLPSLLLQSLLRLHLQMFFFELAHPNIEKGIDSVWHWKAFDVSWFNTTIVSLQYMFDEYRGPESKGLPLAEEKPSVFDIYYWWKKSG